MISLKFGKSARITQSVALGAVSVLLGAQPSIAQQYPKQIQQIVERFDKEVSDQVSKAAVKVRSALETEIKRKTQRGDLDAAMAIKGALTQFEQMAADYSAPTTPALSPIGKWHRPDGRVYVVEPQGKGIIVRGNEGAEPIEWMPVGAKFRITFPTLPNTTNYIWPEKDNTWSYSWEDPTKKIGTLDRVK